MSLAMDILERQSPLNGTGYDDMYAHGWCHVFALAIEDEIGCSHFAVIEIPDEVSWEHETDPDDVILNVLHVYAIVEIDGIELALDANGARLADNMIDDCIERYSYGTLDVRLVYSEDQLLDLTRSRTDDLAAFMPLREIEESDRVLARKHVRAVFPDLVFDQYLTAATPSIS